MGCDIAREEMVKEYFQSPIQREFFNMMCGECLGYGMSRFVFEHKFDRSVVVKIETRAGCFQNVHEWELWSRHSESNTSLCKWLAPCMRISNCGIVLIQRRVKPLPLMFKLPKYIPAILSSDTKRDNWGILQNRLVSCDYGRHDAIAEASKGQNMIRAQFDGAKNGYFEYVSGLDS